MIQQMMRWRRLPSAAVLALTLCPWPVQAQSAAALDGTWSDVNYGCEHPWRITVTGDIVLFELPFRRFSEFAYYSTEEKVVETKGNVIDTVTISMTDDDVIDVIGDRFTYTVDGDKFHIHEHRNNRDYTHVRCPARPVASRGGAAWQRS